MSEKVSDDLFDLKNDPRLSVYLYRAGFVCWLLYIMAGAPIMAGLRLYRTDLGILSFSMMLAALTTSMVYDYYHNNALFAQKKKWLAIGYCLLAGLIYFVVMGHKSPALPGWLTF